MFLGGVQYWVYSIKFQQWFPHAATFAAASLRTKLKDRAGQRALLQQIAFDNVLFNPFVYGNFDIVMTHHLDHFLRISQLHPTHPHTHTPPHAAGCSHLSVVPMLIRVPDGPWNPLL